MDVVKVDPIGLKPTTDRKYRLWGEFKKDKKLLKAQACAYCGSTGDLALSGVQNIYGWVILWCQAKKCGKYCKAMRDRDGKLVFEKTPMPAPPEVKP